MLVRLVRPGLLCLLFNKTANGRIKGVSTADHDVLSLIA